MNRGANDPSRTEFLSVQARAQFVILILSVQGRPYYYEPSSLHLHPYQCTLLTIQNEQMLLEGPQIRIQYTSKTDFASEMFGCVSDTHFRISNFYNISSSSNTCGYAAGQLEVNW